MQKKKDFKKQNKNYNNDGLINYLKDFFKVSEEALIYRLIEFI